MNLVHPERVDDLQTEIKRGFSEFNRTSARSKGRRYPEELKALIGQAGAEGMKTAILCRLSGLSSSAVNRYRATAVPKVLAPRRLAVVSLSPVEAPTSAAVVIRLSSGVTIELADGRALSRDLLTILIGLEVRDAASC